MSTTEHRHPTPVPGATVGLAGSALDSLASPIAVVDADGRIVEVNRAWRLEESRRPDGEAGSGIGDGYLSVSGATGAVYRRAMAEGLAGVLRGRDRDFHMDFPRLVDGERRWISLQIDALPGGGGAVMTHVDVTARRTAIDVLESQAEFLQLVASGATLSACLRRLAELTEALLPSAHCSIMLGDGHGRLWVVAAPSLPPLFVAGIDGAAATATAAGAAVTQRAMVVSADIGTDPAWSAHRALALDHGLRSCWSTPILPGSGGDVLGTFAVFHRRVCEPSAAETELVALWTQLAAFAVERDRRSRELARSEAETAAVLSASADGIIIVADTGRVRSANPSASRMFKTARVALEGTPVGRLLRFEDPTADFSAAPVGQTRQVTALRALAVMPSGEEVPVEVSLSEHDIDGSWLTTVTLRDITQRRALEDRLAHQATHDSLTGLPKRVLLVERLSQALDAADEQVAVLFLDLDRFKVVNDSLGHDNGDRLLAVIGRRLRTALPGHMVARLGGDEFAVVCAGAPTDLGALCAQIAAVVAEPVSLGVRHVTTSTSIGVALRTGSADTAESLLHDADVALYQAKAMGGARVCVFDEALRGRSLERLELEEALVTAMVGSQFVLHYQPQVRITTGEVIGAEALLRWRHPERGLLAPGEFLGVAEQMGLIVQIGAWVFDTALAEAARWRRELGVDVTISVNVSARQIEHATLVDEVARAIEMTGLPPSLVCLEITETDLLHDRSLPVLHRLKDLGLRIALDDFGVGFSSLDYLRRFPVADQLKVDRSFTAVVNEPGGHAITGAVVALAHGLGMESVAEGIEDADQLASLASLGCDIAQGYLTGRPMPASEIFELLRRGAPHGGAVADEPAAPTRADRGS